MLSHGSVLTGKTAVFTESAGGRQTCGQRSSARAGKTRRRGDGANHCADTCAMGPRCRL